VKAVDTLRGDSQLDRIFDVIYLIEGDGSLVPYKCFEGARLEKVFHGFHFMKVHHAKTCANKSSTKEMIPSENFSMSNMPKKG